LPNPAFLETLMGYWWNYFMNRPRTSRNRDSNDNSQETNGMISGEFSPNRVPTAVNRFTLNNICGKVLAQLKTNQFFSETGTEATPSDNPIELNLSLDVNINKLIEQSSCFANDFLSYGDINYVSLLGRNETDWAIKLQKVYIYSYYKSIVLGCSRSIIHEQYGDSRLFVGHAVLYDLIRTRNFNYEYTPGLNVIYNLNITQDKKDYIVKSLCDRFPFLEDCTSLEVGIGTNVLNTEFERILHSISNHNVYSQGCIIVNLTDRETSQREFIMADKLPLGNCMYKENDYDCFYYSFSALQNVKDYDISWGRACFITCNDTSMLQNYHKIYYNNPKLFSKFDCSSIVGKRIKYNPGSNGIYSTIPTTPLPPSVGNEPSPSGKQRTSIDPVSVLDKVSSLVTDDARSLVTDIELENEQLEKLSDQLDVKFVRLDSTSIKDVLPFSIDKNLDITKIFSKELINDLLYVIERSGLRFSYDNFKYDKGLVKTIDDNVSIKVDQSAKEFVDIIKVLKILTGAWLAKTQNVISINDFLNSVEITDKSIKVNIVNNYQITVYGGNVVVTPDGINLNPITGISATKKSK
jgi:hypothetical protein